MSCIFISYRGKDRSFVIEIEKQLRTYGLPYQLKHDVDEGDLRNLGYDLVWQKVKEKLVGCKAMILLVGDTTHSPRRTLARELDYAISKNWYIFGIRLPNRYGSAPSKVKNYPKYIEISSDNPSHIVSVITKNL